RHEPRLVLGASQWELLFYPGPSQMPLRSIVDRRPNGANGVHDGDAAQRALMHRRRQRQRGLPLGRLRAQQFPPGRRQRRDVRRFGAVHQRCDQHRQPGGHREAQRPQSIRYLGSDGLEERRRRRRLELAGYRLRRRAILMTVIWLNRRARFARTPTGGWAPSVSLALSLSLALSVSLGCSGGGKTGNPNGRPATGTVTYKGQPVDGATVSFISPSVSAFGSTDAQEIG